MANQKQSPKRLCYQLFDQSVCIESNVPSFTPYFDRLFQRFLIADSGLPPQYKLLSAENNHWHLTIRDATWTVPAAPNSAETYAEKIIFDILSLVETHYLFHAGVIAWQENAVGLIGASHRGKSTLAAALTLAGASLLSDETLAIRRTDGTVTPYPRAIQLRKGSAALLNLTLPESANGRFTLPLFEQTIQSATLRHLVFLEPHSAEPTPANTLFLWHSHITPAWLAHVQTHPGVNAATQKGNSIRITGENVISAFQQLEQDSPAFGVCILNAAQTPIQQPDFTHSAELSPISKAEAAHRLISHFQNGINATLLRTQHKGNSSDLFMAIIRLLAEVDPYVLRVGPLDQMISLVHSLRM